MPTETVYGLAANALDERAVAKVFAAKERPSFDPLIVHVPGLEQAMRLAHFSSAAERLAQAFWPGSLTLVLPRRVDEQGKSVVPDLVTAGLDSVGLRVPDHPVAAALLIESGCPLAAPSANRFGSISPTTAQHVVDELDGRVDVVLDGGPCRRGVESTVVRVGENGVEVLRLGALPLESIERAAGVPVTVCPPTSSPGDQARLSPGLTDRHYAPGTPMMLIDSLADLDAIDRPGRWGLIGVGLLPSGFAAAQSLSETGDLNEAASKLFATLRAMDAMELDGIVALKVRDEGIGRAINDRLERGSTR